MRRKQTWTKQFGNGSFCTQLLGISSYLNKFQEVLKYQRTVAQKSYSAHNGQRLAFATLPGRIEEFHEKRAESVA